MSIKKEVLSPQGAMPKDATTPSPNLGTLRHN